MLKLKHQLLMIGILCVLNLPISRVFSQAELSHFRKSNDAPVFDMVVVNFASEDPDLSRLDLYIKITNNQIQFIKSKDGGFIAEYEISVDIFNKDGERVDGKIWKEETTTNNFDETTSISLSRLSYVSFDLPLNEYQISVSLRDLETLRTGQQKSSIALRDYSKDELSVSDILYLDYLFLKEDGNLDLHPKVSNERYEKSQLYAYFEVYNIGAYDSVRITYEILNSGKKSVQKSGYWLKGEGRITPNFFRIVGDSLAHDIYKIQLTLGSNGKTVSIEHSFKWYWSGIPVSFAKIEDAIEKLVYIATKKELKKLKKAKEEVQRKEFLKFWKLHDPTPETHENELMEEYYRRIDFATEHFSGFKDGWKTDMGMLYVKLGPPDVVDRDHFNQNFAFLSGRTIKSLEAWMYYQYNRQFIFVDENGFGEYRLANPQAFYDIIDR